MKKNKISRLVVFAAAAVLLLCAAAGAFLVLRPKSAPEAAFDGIRSSLLSQCRDELSDGILTDAVSSSMDISPAGEAETHFRRAVIPVTVRSLDVSALISGIEIDIQAECEKAVDALELDTLLSDKYDGHNAMLSIHAGSGGVEAQDWASMLYRMYTRYCEKHGFKVELIDMLPGEEAGIKSVTFGVEGLNAYGYLKAEKGVHRLVRISPFDAAKRRHTSFDSLDVIPQVEFDDEIELKEDEYRKDTFRASGAGGQHINKTDSAIRLTHYETGIVVSCQDERSQHANLDKALRLLKAKLLDRQRQMQEDELNGIRGEQQDNGWGSQIRSYVFAPYKMVKDHRTSVEVGNVDAVMDGDLDAFIFGYLKSTVKAEG